VGFAFFVTSTSGLPPELWEPLAPQGAASTGTSGGVSIAVVVALLAVVLVAGFVVGEYAPTRRRQPGA
jgi:hypothetical protein